MLFLLVAAVFGLGKVDNGLHRHSPSEAWELWKNMYQHTETFAEHLLGDMKMREDIFRVNHAYVRAHNLQNHTYTLELNEFAAMEFGEFQMRNGFIGSTMKAGEAHVMVGDSPAAVDWRDKLVTPVKNQGGCGSCWTFSAVASMEGQYAKLTEKLTSLSEQDLVDCVKKVKIPGDSGTCCDGCQGGLMDAAFRYVIDSQSGEDDLESEYEYKGKNGRCEFTEGKAFTDAKVVTYKDITEGSETELQDAVATVGPISVAVNAGGPGWQLYSHGIMKPFLCNKDRLDHGVTVVGYGTDGGDYWIIKNSWGKTWGEDGYVRLNKGDNTCGVAQQASYPVMQAA